MLDNTARYVYEVYRLKSVSAAAKELYVSQPAISAAIQKAEKALGAPIFNRKTLPFMLTAEGEIYIRAVEEMLLIENRAAAELQSLNEIYNGTLRIAFGDPFSAKLVSGVIQQFHQTYPQISIHVLWIDASRLYEIMDKEVADIIFRPLDSLRSEFAISTLIHERSVLALHKDTDIPEELRSCAITKQELLEKTYPPEKIVSDFSLLKDVEFINITNVHFIHRRREELFGKYKLAPRLVSSTVQMDVNFNLMSQGYGALLGSETQLGLCPQNEDCLYFALGGPKAFQPYSVVYRKEEREHIRTPINAFIETAKSFCECENPIMKILSF